MGKTTDKLFVTQSERADSAKRADNSQLVESTKPPFWTCCISQQPCSDPVCDREGHVFDLTNLFPYIRKHKCNPVTYEPMTTKDVIKLKITRNASGDVVDPVSLKLFQRRTDAVVIWCSGNVYAMDTIKENNIGPQNWRDLISEQEFTKDDIVHLVGGLGVGAKAAAPEKSEKQQSKRQTVEVETVDNTNKSTKSTGNVAASLTSTAVGPQTKTQYQDIDVERSLKPKKFTTTGYATIETNMGKLNVELDPKYSPKAVYNFVKLAQSGYYDGVVFHRSIKHFMLQGGDPTGTGKGGQSIFGHGFGNETNTPKKHDARGILSMANTGAKNSNKSQFFVTYRPAPHLDGAHTVFGKVVGGLDVLEKIELVDTDDNDRPKREIKMVKVTVHEDPFKDMFKDQEQEQEEEVAADAPFLRSQMQADDEPVGKYLTTMPNFRDTPAPDSMKPGKRRKVTSIAKSDFSAW